MTAVPEVNRGAVDGLTLFEYNFKYRSIVWPGDLLASFIV